MKIVLTASLLFLCRASSAPAVGVFGSGSPRAFQLAARISFQGVFQF
jgi:hypothetical protein